MNKILITLILFFPLSTQAFSPLNVVINEIAWMGTKASSSDEWIELYNNTNQDIDLNGWSLYEDKTLIEPLTNIVKARSYYLIERTDDSTIKNIKASQEPTPWGGYGLNNKGENLKLLDKESKIIDQVDNSQGWLGGDSVSFKTMERIDSLKIGSDKNNWQTSSSQGGSFDSDNNPINGTPNSKNSIKSKPKEYPLKIIINEILPSPKGSDSENEWIELKNLNNKEVSLFGWIVRDKKGTIQSYSFPEKTIIEPQGFLILTRPISNITLNNSEDGLELLQPNNNIVSSVNYINAPLNKSYNYINNEWVWSNQLSPNKENLINKDNLDNKDINKKETKKETIVNKPKKKIERPKTEYINVNQNKEIIDKNNFISILSIAVLSSLLFSFFIFKLNQRLEEYLISKTK